MPSSPREVAEDTVPPIISQASATVIQVANASLEFVSDTTTTAIDNVSPKVSPRQDKTEEGHDAKNSDIPDGDITDGDDDLSIMSNSIESLAASFKDSEEKKEDTPVVTPVVTPVAPGMGEDSAATLLQSLQRKKSAVTLVETKRAELAATLAAQKEAEALALSLNVTADMTEDDINAAVIANGDDADRAATLLQSLKRRKDAQELTAKKRRQLRAAEDEQNVAKQADVNAATALTKSGVAADPPQSAALPPTSSPPPNLVAQISALEAQVASLTAQRDAGNARFARVDLDLTNLQHKFAALAQKEESEHTALQSLAAQNEILTLDLHEQQQHDEEVKSMDNLFTEISTTMTDEQLSATVQKLVQEYLMFCDYRNTVDCMVAEARCMRFKPNFGMQQEHTAAKRALQTKLSLLASFDSGDEPAFFSAWSASVPPHLVATSKPNKTLKFLLHLHFATFQLKQRILVDRQSAFPMSPAESMALSKLKSVLHDSSEDPDLSTSPTLFPYFSLATLTHPHAHPTFSSPESSTCIFGATFALTLRDDLISFCDNRLPLVSPPKLVTLFQAFHKWETSLQNHVQSSTKLSFEFKDLCSELLGQNVKLVGDASKPGATFTPAYLSNMKRFILSKKAQINSMGLKIEPSKDQLRQPPPLSFGALTDFLEQHRSETKLVGHVLHALTRRMAESGDYEIRRHAAHDASVGDVLTFFSEPSTTGQEPSVILSLLSLESKTENDSRATFYAALLLSTMAKYKAGRIYLLSHESQPVIGALLTLFENSFKGVACLEAGTMALIGLQRLSIENKAAMIMLRQGVMCRVLTVLVESVGERGGEGGEKGFFLAKTMIDSDDQTEQAVLDNDPEYSSPLRRKDKWGAGEAWDEVRMHCVSYCAGLCTNVAGSEDEGWDAAYMGGRGEGGGDGGDEVLTLLLKAARGGNSERSAEGFLGAAYGYIASMAARTECKKAGAEVEIDTCLEGSSLNGWMLTSMLNRIMSDQGVAGEEAWGEAEEEDLTMDENTTLQFQSTIEAEEKIHSAIEGVESGELPPGWEEAVDSSSGLRYFFKSDGSSSSWVLPSRSDAILEAFFLSKH